LQIKIIHKPKKTNSLLAHLRKLALALAVDCHASLCFHGQPRRTRKTR